MRPQRPRRPQRPAPVSRKQANAVIIITALVLLACMCGLIKLAGTDDDEPTAQRAADAPAAAATTAAAVSTAAPSPTPTDNVPGYMAALKAIRASLATDEKKALSNGRNTCLDITQGKPQSTVVSNTRQRFSVDAATAAKIVAAAQTHLCPSAVLAADPPKQQTTPPGNGGGDSGDDGGEVYYRNCDEVRAAGKAPLRRGQPGYRSALDRDGDGTACDK